MDAFSSPYLPATGIDEPPPHQRPSGTIRKNGMGGSFAHPLGNGVPVPAGPHARTQSIPLAGHGDIVGVGAFGGARSPPSSKSTDALVHHGARGNCKFGGKCALLHILPDGRVVNRPYMNRGQFGAGPRMDVLPFINAPPPSSLISREANQAAYTAMAGPPYVFPGQDEYTTVPKQHMDAIPTIDTTLPSYTSSAFGSPQNDCRLPGSPAQQGLSILEVGLPRSFDSNGISNARYGPHGASVPSRFGIESPPSSFSAKPAYAGNSALRDLHESVYGEEGRASPRGLNGVLHGFGPSPPTAEEESLTFSKRPLHSERLANARLQRFARPGTMSQSLGTHMLPTEPETSDDSDDLGFEEDLVPHNLSDLLTPQERMRRSSRSAADEEGSTSRSISIQRQTASNSATPQDSKMGSPQSSSPSRFAPLFAARNNSRSDTNDSTFAFGHVGSPLRNSSLPPLTSASSNPASGDVSPFVSSPPRQSSMSNLTKQLQQSRLGLGRRNESTESNQNLHPSMANRAMSNGSITPAPSRSGADRATSSSSSIGRERIDEEPTLFSMEGLEDEKLDFSKKEVPKVSNKTVVNGWGDGVRVNGSVWGGAVLSNKAEPVVGVIGGLVPKSSSNGIWGNGL
ncbi:hypothetical protein LTR50_007575 [Elasticomyces elasticus]|nr:hypothetical protein LTR50_007575 [Elasticomyces elasticus]